MNLKTFKRISTQVADLEKAGIEFDVAIRNDYEYQKGYEQACFEPIFYTINTVAQLAGLQTVLGKAIKLASGYNKIAVQGLKPTPCIAPVATIAAACEKSPGDRIKYPTLKFFSNQRNNIGSNFEIWLITSPPSEITEDDITYRYIGNDEQCTFCVPHDHPLYNYLDKNFFFLTLNKTSKKERTVIANELTLDTFLVMVMLYLQPLLIKHLADECFINANQAKLIRVKMEKDLKPLFKTLYDNARTASVMAHERFANSNILQKLAEGKVSHVMYNDIKLTQNTASYETVKIEAEGLFKVLQSEVFFDDRTDIYVLVRGYIAYVVKQLEAEDLTVTEEGQTVKNVEHTFRINDISITLKRTSENTRRYINNVMINKAEVEAVAERASCAKNQEDFDKLIESVHKMSLKWHDAWANGIPVKIHDSLTSVEYTKSEAPSTAPRIRFKYEDEVFKLVVDENTSVRIKFNEALSKLKALNRKINCCYYDNYSRRNVEWGRKELVNVLKECCTFTTKTKELDEKGKPITDEVENPVIKADGTPELDEAGKPKMVKIKTPRIKVTTECTLTDENAKFIEKMAREYQEKAIKKSETFLADAVKRTGAQLVDFNGEPHYVVEGKIRKYAINKRTNQVHNYETKRYICIVEPGHKVGVGYDALAARLYALKNDERMVGEIGTLRGA